MKRIIVCSEKHGDYYFDASTDEAWAKSSLAILTSRFKDGYWYYDPKDSYSYDISHIGPVLSKEQIEALPTEALQKQERAKVAKLTRIHTQIAEERQEYDLIVKTVGEQDLGFYTYRNGRTEPIAWRLLDSRSDHEYERVSLETVQEG